MLEVRFWFILHKTTTTTSVLSLVSLSVVLLLIISSASKRMRHFLARSTTIIAGTHTVRTQSATHTQRTVSTCSLRRGSLSKGCLQICDVSPLLCFLNAVYWCCVLLMDRLSHGRILYFQVRSHKFKMCSTFN